MSLQVNFFVVFEETLVVSDRIFGSLYCN